MGQKKVLELGIFEPDTLLLEDLSGALKSNGMIVISASSKAGSLEELQSSNLPRIDGAFVGTFGSDATEMSEIIAAIKSKYPQAYLVGMLDSTKFKVEADYTTLYENLYSNLDWIVAQIIQSADINS